jgi:hypothetical protein
MEQRQNSRFPVHVEVRYTILGLEPKQLNGYACDVSERGLRLVTDVELKPGAFLRIEMEDAAMFAEVKYTTPWMDMHVSGVYVEEVLLGTSELSKLILATMSQVPKMTAAAVHTS